VDKLGFWELNEEMKNLANQMNLEQMWEDIVRKAKEVTKSRLDLKSKGMVQILCN
jgi:predicted PilT family ATPase